MDYDYECMDCGEPFNTSDMLDEPHHCPHCESTLFITADQAHRNRVINERDDELEERRLHI